MTVNKDCFGRAGEFAPFSQANFVDDNVTTINVQTGRSQTHKPDRAGMCWAYACLWLRNMKANKRYKVTTLPTIDAIWMQADLKGRFDASNTANALLLVVGGNQSNQGIVAGLVGDASSIESHLNVYATSANFVMFTLEGQTGGQPVAHAVIAKLDKSWTGGRLNCSYPCSLFDPNVGQGMYSNHKKMAADLRDLIRAYRWVTQVRAQLIQLNNVD